MPQPGTSGMEPSFGDAYGNHRCFLILEPCTISPLGSGTEYEEKGMVLMLGSPATTRKRPFELLSDLVDDGFSEDPHHERWDVSALDDIAQCSKGSLEGELVTSEGMLTAKRSRSMEGPTEQAGSVHGQQAQASPKTEIMAGSDSEAQVQGKSPEAEVTEMKPPPLEQRCGEHNYSLQAEPRLGSGTESGDTEEETQGAAVETTADVNSRFSGPECVPDSQVIRQPKKRRCFWEYSQSHVAESKRKCSRQSLCWSSTTLPSTLYLRECTARKGKKYPRKARKTDASDLTPNPQKLCTIGEQLHKLNAAIEGMIPANDLPIVARARSRKEKNKLASRACRLKKKAQHEANKIKLWGLNQEYENLLRALLRIKEVIRRRVESSKADNEMGMTDVLESILKESAGPRVAGQTKEFVERILETNAV